MSNFFSDESSQKIVAEIASVERLTIGEVRLHIEDFCDSDPLERAIQVFEKLGMQKTKNRSGILIYLASQSRKIAIYGDEGIHNKVGKEYWNNIVTQTILRIQSEDMTAAMIQVIKELGEPLAEHFPETNQEINELTNEISYGKV
jgi:uncharacterized membrane protein